MSADAKRLGVSEVASLQPHVGDVLSLFWANDRLGRIIATSLRLGAHEVPALIYLSMLGRLTPSEFSRRMHLSPATITAVLDRLEAASLVERSRDSADGRKDFVSLTERGESVAGWARSQSAYTLRGVPADVVDGFASDIGKLTDSISAQADRLHGRSVGPYGTELPQPTAELKIIEPRAAPRP